MIHLLLLAVHLLATIAKLVRPGGVRAVVAESLLLKKQLLISSRSLLDAPAVGRIEARTLQMMATFPSNALGLTLGDNASALLGSVENALRNKRT
jgi:hypothetical protein